MCRCRGYLKHDVFHGEATPTLPHNVEQLLEGEGLDVQAKLALAQLNPMGKHIVLLVDVISEFADVFLRLLRIQMPYFMDDAVDERRDAIDERDFGTLLQCQPLAFLYTQSGHGQLLLQILFLLTDGRCLLTDRTSMTSPAKEEQQQKNHQHANGGHDGPDEDIELCRRLFQLSGTGLQRAILTCLLLQIQINIAVQVAVCLIVDSSIGHAELLADAGHEVRSLVDNSILQGELQLLERLLVVVVGKIARS